MKLLIVGDVVGNPGRRAVKSLVPGLRREFQVDLVIANAENSAGGVGVTAATATELLHSEVDILTTGNHIWNKKEIIPYLDGKLPIVRPLNFPPGLPGRGYLEVGNTIVVNLVGRTFMAANDCPFRTMDKLLTDLDCTNKIVIVDFHAEATSEKGAMSHYLDGRVSAVVGTHTHVGTVDTRILLGGTACVSDIGMAGAIESIIGDDIESVIQRFLKQMPHAITVGKGNLFLNSVLIEVDDNTGKAIDIKRVDRKVG